MTDRYALFGFPLGTLQVPADPRRVRAADRAGPDLRGDRDAGRRVRRRRRPLPGRRRARLQRHASVQARRVRLRDRPDGARPPRRCGQLHEVRRRSRHGREFRRPGARQMTFSATWDARSAAVACCCWAQEAPRTARCCPSWSRSPRCSSSRTAPWPKPRSWVSSSRSYRNLDTGGYSDFAEAAVRHRRQRDVREPAWRTAAGARQGLREGLRSPTTSSTARA